MENTKFCAERISAARNGDQEAIADLYNCAYQDVHIVIRSMIRADEDTVLDLLQDTFIKAFQRLDQLDDPHRFKAWIKQIARNTVLDHLKKSRALLFSELQDDDSLPIEIEDEDLSHLPDIVMDKQETVRLLHKILNSLPEAQRAVISMHYLQEIPIKEIAAILGRSENTIKVQLRNGRLNLEKKIRELEKKEDIKLYSLAPLPFLLLLLRNMEAIPVQPDAVVLGNILQSGTAAAGSAATAAAATAKAAGAAKAAGTAAAKGILGKIVAGVAAVTLCGSAAGMYLSQSQQPATVPTEPTHQIIETTVPVQTETQSELYDYETLMEDYLSIIAGEIPIDQASIDLSQSALWETPVGCTIDENGYFTVRGTVRYSFVKIDLDGDLIEELISLEEYKIGDNDWHGAILDIFTMKDERPNWLIAGAYRGDVDIFEDGIIRYLSHGGAHYYTYHFYTIQDGELSPVMTAGEEDRVFSVNGEVCTYDKFLEAVDQYAPILALDLERLCMIEP